MYCCIDTEYWIESDTELDMDFTSNSTPPLEMNIDEPGDNDQLPHTFIVKWIVFLLAYFQARFFLSGPMHSYWLFPFERYNGLLGNQPTNNRSIELQLMRHFQRDNTHPQLINQAKEWPDSDMFLNLITDANKCDTSKTLPCFKYIIGTLVQEELSILQAVYCKL